MTFCRLDCFQTQARVIYLSGKQRLNNDINHLLITMIYTLDLN
jgi:hypothetical protein